MIRQHLNGEFPAQCLSRSGIEQVGNLVQPLLAHQRQIGALGQVLPEQAVRVLVTAPLLRAVRVSEVDLHSCARCQLRMPGHLAALVMGHGFQQCRCHPRKFSRHRFQRGVCGGRIQLGQNDETARALNHRRYCRAIVRAHDQVAFPVAWHLSAFDFFRPVADILFSRIALAPSWRR